MSENTQERRLEDALKALEESKQESKQESKRKDRQVKEKERENKKLKSDNEKLILDNEAKDCQVKEAELDKEAVSLYAVFCGTKLVKILYCTGSTFSNLDPKTHLSAYFVNKKFVCDRKTFILLVEKWKSVTGIDPKLKNSISQLIVKFVNQRHAPKCSNEAAVVCYINTLLDDVAAICNLIVSMCSGTLENVPAQLEVRQDIFSNRCDHVVIFDTISKVPIFCVETKNISAKKSKTAEKMGVTVKRMTSFMPCVC